MKAGKIFGYVISIIFALPLIVGLWSAVDSLLGFLGIHSLRVSVLVTGAVIIFIIIKLCKPKKNSTLRTQVITNANRAGVMNNHAKTTNCDRYEQSSCNAVPAGFMEDSLNGVIWRWRPKHHKVEVLGAYCSKCQTQLTSVKTTESWQADLKCPACGKTFVSMPNYELSGKVCTFAQTKKLVAKVIGDRHTGHL